MGEGHAYFILSSFYESAALPGEDAQFVHSICEGYLKASRETERSFQKHA